MIPGGGFTPAPIVAQFKAPYDLPYNPLLFTAMGGAALGDASQGRLVKQWTAAYDGAAIQVKPEDGPVSFTLAVPGVETLSLAFDNNMGTVLAWTTASGASLYYFDTVAGQFTTRAFSGVDSCRVVVDDARDFNTTLSDVIFGYTSGGSLFYRQQRDRYDVPYLIGSTTKRLRRLAPSVLSRLQFQML